MPVPGMRRGRKRRGDNPPCLTRAESAGAGAGPVRYGGVRRRQRLPEEVLDLDVGAAQVVGRPPHQGVVHGGVKAQENRLPAGGLAHLLFALIVVLAHLFATNPAVATTLAEGSPSLAQALFAPLLAVWSIGVGMAISARSSGVRTAQRLEP